MEIAPPPAQAGQSDPDSKDLRTLSILHTVYGSFNLLVVLIMWIVNGVMLKMIKVIPDISAEAQIEPGKGASPAQSASEKQVEELLQGSLGSSLFDPRLLLILGAALCLGCLLYFWSASCMKQRKSIWVPYVASFAALFNVPLGLALGIYTFVILGRPGVKSQFH